MATTETPCRLDPLPVNSFQFCKEQHLTWDFGVAALPNRILRTAISGALSALPASAQLHDLEQETARLASGV
jgi:hypothetical protein